MDGNSLEKNQILITLIIILFFCITGATYAYFAISATDNTTITGAAATVNLTLDVTKIFPASNSSNTGVLVPQLSTSASSSSPLSTALKNGCVDANRNVVCQVYQISIQNKGGTATQVVDGTLLFYSDATLKTNVHTVMPNLKWKLIDSVDVVTPANSVLGSRSDLEANNNSTNGRFVTNLSLAMNASQRYYVIVWINEIGTDQTDKSTSSDNPKVFYGKVQFDSSNGTGVTSTFQT